MFTNRRFVAAVVETIIGFCGLLVLSGVTPTQTLADNPWHRTPGTSVVADNPWHGSGLVGGFAVAGDSSEA
jgi:hypothetical protein